MFESWERVVQQQRTAFNQTRQPAETAAVAEPEDVQVSWQGGRAGRLSELQSSNLRSFRNEITATQGGKEGRGESKRELVIVYAACQPAPAAG